jgi:2-haloalkanoic acid dehalogenase type II
MSADSSIELILLDLDDTLWPCEPVIEEAERAVYTWLRCNCPELTRVHDIDSLRRHRQALRSERPAMAHDITALRVASLALLLRQAGCPSALADQAVHVFLEARHRVTPYPEVRAELAVLRRHYRLVSVTNGNADVDRTPLRGCFDLSLNATDAGAAKPAPDLFLLALQRTGVRPARAVHVGDDPELDVEAAREAGLRAVWMNRNGAAWPAHLSPPEAGVRDLRALRRWLAEGRGPAPDRTRRHLPS